MDVNNMEEFFRECGKSFELEGKRRKEVKEKADKLDEHVRLATAKLHKVCHCP